MNADYRLIVEFLAGSRTPVAIQSSPLAAALKAHLLDADASGKSALCFEPPDHFIQGARVLQGGTVATMLDFALAFAVLAALPPERTCTTASLTTNFLKAAAPGKYVARGTVDRLGTSVAFSSAVLTRADNEQIVATATAVMPIVHLGKVSRE